MKNSSSHIRRILVGKFFAMCRWALNVKPGTIFDWFKEQVFKFVKSAIVIKPVLRLKQGTLKQLLD